MDFDLGQISAPFRMQPGLRRLAEGAAHLTPLRAGSALHAEKHAVWAAGASRHALPGFDTTPALAAIAAAAHAQGLADKGLPPELAYEEDFALLDATGTLPWLCVCVPSHWAPEDKPGLSLAAVHAPVADNAALLAAMAGLVQLVTQGGHWERFVWTITPSPAYDQHPDRQPRRPWPETADPRTFAAGCFLRVERQTFLPAGAGQALFTIRVMLAPLAEAVSVPGDARRLHDALASMSGPVLAYKGLAPARERLLAWLNSITMPT